MPGRDDIAKALMKETDPSLGDLFGMDFVRPVPIMPNSGVPGAQSLGVGGGTAAPPPPGIKAYHGSPHSFDKFDISKIGTGEGAQAYGHGLYFAENEGVARQYRDNLARPNFNRTQSGAPISSDLSRILEDSYDDAMRQGVSAPLHRDAIHLAQQNLDRQRQDALKAQDFDWFNKVSDQITELQRMGKDVPATKGSMYEVGIRADPESFLDYDALLSKQGLPVRSALSKLAADYPPPGGGEYPAHRWFGDTVQRWVSSQSGGMANAAQALKEVGIPGIKYLDAGSRNNASWKIMSPDESVSGKWVVSQFGGANPTKFDNEADARAFFNKQNDSLSRNFVVFDPGIIDVIKKYGIAGALGAGLISEQEAQLAQQQGLGQGGGDDDNNRDRLARATMGF